MPRSYLPTTPSSLRNPTVDYHTGDVLTSGVQAPGDNVLYGANPYRDATYKVGAWDQFLNWLGFRSNADAWQENMAVQAREYDSAITQQLRNEQYDSPSQQVARMRAAGLNPDLNGGDGISPGASEPGEPDPSTPQASESDSGLIAEGTQRVSQFTSFIGNTLQSAIALVSGLQGVKRNSLQNTSLSLGNLSGQTELAQILGSMLIPMDNGDDDTDWKFDAINTAQTFLGGTHLSKRDRHNMMVALQGFWNSAPANAEKFQQWLKYAKGRKDFFYETSESWSPDDGSMRAIFGPLGKAGSEIRELNLKYQKATLQSGIAEEQNDLEYENQLDAGQQARAENQTNAATEYRQELDRILNKALDDMVSGIEKNGGPFKDVLLTLIALGRLYFQSNSLPSPQRNKGKGADTSNNGVSYVESYDANGALKGVKRSYTEMTK